MGYGQLQRMLVCHHHLLKLIEFRQKKNRGNEAWFCLKALIYREKGGHKF